MSLMSQSGLEKVLSDALKEPGMIKVRPPQLRKDVTAQLNWLLSGYDLDALRGHEMLYFRPAVETRKRLTLWRFAGTVKGAKASANRYSLIETAKANGIEPHRYLTRLFTDLPKAKTVENIEQLLPWNLERPAPT